MIELGGKRILLGGIHDHWARADMDNPTLFLATLNYYHYDFITLQDGPEHAPKIQAAAEAFSDRIRIYPGNEEAYAWGHVVTVNPHGTPPSSDDPDPARVLSQLQKTCDLVILAHPNYPTTWDSLYKTGEMDRLMDNGVMDGINIVNTDGFEHPQHRELVTWFRARDAAGKRTPIVGGWDLHIIVPAGKLPPVLYTAQRPPRGHYESKLGTRTILFAEENSLPAICAAVKEGKTIIEDLATGELAGPAKLVEFLLNNGYHEELARLDTRRDAVTLTVPVKWRAGANAELTVSENGTLRLPRSLTKAESVSATGGATIPFPSLPAFLQRNSFYAPVSWHGADGTERIWAVEVEHPVQFEVLPWLGEDGPAIELLPKVPFRGIISLEVDDLIPRLEKTIAGRTLIPVQPAKTSRLTFNYRFEARTESGISRTQSGFLMFVGVPRFQGYWNRIANIGVDKAEFAPRFLFGANRPWPGPKEYSAQLQFAWTDTDFLMRIELNDPIHHQPYAGHYAYNGDCLQLALDPMLRRRDTIGNVYSFNLSLTQQGPEVYRFLTPTEEASERFTPPKGDVSLGGRYLQIEKVDGGLVYLLKLPWSELGPVAPAPGVRMGIYYIMFNNNGSGHVDAMHWPVPIQGMWMLPNRWGAIELLAR